MKEFTNKNLKFPNFSLLFQFSWAFTFTNGGISFTSCVFFPPSNFISYLSSPCSSSSRNSTFNEANTLGWLLNATQLSDILNISIQTKIENFIWFYRGLVSFNVKHWTMEFEGIRQNIQIFVWNHQQQQTRENNNCNFSISVAWWCFSHWPDAWNYIKKSKGEYWMLI